MRFKATTLLTCLIVLAFLIACTPGAPASTYRVPASTYRAPARLTRLPITPSPTQKPTPTHTPSPSPTPTPPPTPIPFAIQVIQIPAPSLQGNLLGEPEEQAVTIFLPPSYDLSQARYPTVYFLPGFGSDPNGASSSFPEAELASSIADGSLKEMILVVPNGANVLHGSFYVNSPVTGNWEDFIVKDVIGYIDSNYRTLPTPEGRGLGGFSMGGFGAINLAMRHPDIFSAAYLLSPALFDENGLQDSHMFNTENKPRAFLKTISRIKKLPTQEALHEMSRLEGAQGFTMAYGPAFAPDPEGGLPFFDYPYQMKGDQAVKIRPTWKLWQNGLGDWEQKISQFHDNLASLSGIVIDYAADDGYIWIPHGSEYLSQQLTAAGISNQIFSYPGIHGELVHNRLMTIMLPFFNRVLADPDQH